MARNGMTAGEMRHMWATNVTPFVTAAREGATHANRVAHQEWDRAHRRAQMRRRAETWRESLMMFAAGLAIVGVIGGIAAIMARRRAGMDADLAAVRDEAKAGLRSSMESGRERTTGTARDMAQKVRRPGPGEPMTG